MQDKFNSTPTQSTPPVNTSAYDFPILDGSDIPAPAPAPVPAPPTNTANTAKPQLQAEIKRLMQRVAKLRVRASQPKVTKATEYRDRKEDNGEDDEDGDGGWTTASEEDEDEEDKKHQSKSKAKFGDGSDARRRKHTTITSSTRVDVVMTNQHSSTTTNPRAGANTANGSGRSTSRPTNHGAPPPPPPRAPAPPPPFSANPNYNPNPNPYSSFSAHTGIYTPKVSISHGMSAGGGWGGAPPPPRHPHPPPPPPPPPFRGQGPRINIISGGYPYDLNYYPSGHYTSDDGRTTANVGCGNVSYSSVENCGNNYSRNYVYGEPEGNRSRRGGDYH
ncbi:hypothetical protein CVT26_014442 [Gymnopilus dilepis]|uniref:Uncharacterized protein n=1 Tax=Gymnopilus dilepis TaxID=231916 RepID=A0A409VV70_9AGAR|nr:hypothetical protein CVT26_014442 [Gymnopilus dilepis]